MEEDKREREKMYRYIESWQCFEIRLIYNGVTANNVDLVLMAVFQNSALHVVFDIKTVWNFHNDLFGLSGGSNCYSI